jgi:hypothetical protein
MSFFTPIFCLVGIVNMLSWGYYGGEQAQRGIGNSYVVFWGREKEKNTFKQDRMGDNKEAARK